MGDIWEEIQDLLMSQKYGKVMIIYLFFGDKRFQLGGYIIILNYVFVFYLFY